MKNQNAPAPSFTSTLCNAIRILHTKYPNTELSFTFQPGTHTWDSPDGKLYLWATQEDATHLTFLPTDTDEIDDAGICTRELTTPEGLTIIIAEDF